MKHFLRIVALLIVLAIVLVGLGYDVPYISDLPFIDKPENAVKSIMTQEKLMEFLSYFEKYYSELDPDSEDYSMMLSEFFTSPAVKSFLLDNVHTINYNITNVSKNGDNATVTALITHLDIYPVIDRVYDLFVSKLKELDSIPEKEEDKISLILPLLQKSIKDATSQTKPTVTYSNVIFECEKYALWSWELKEVPDDFIEVLLMNIDPSMEKASKEYFFDS